jgi:ribosomal protein S15P/S13E
MQESHRLQTYIFEEIQSRFAKKTEAIDALCDLLQVGKDAVYRRFRGDSILTPQEIEVLTQKFNISLDAFIFQKSDNSMWSYQPFTSEKRSFEAYFEGLYRDTANLTRLPDVHIYYASSEISIFYYTFFPEIFTFKLYTWGRDIWNFDYLKNRKFNFDIVPLPVWQKAEQALKIYFQLPSTEMWTIDLLGMTLSQIEYYFNSGAFENPNDALVLCKKLQELTEHFERMAQTGKKFLVNSPPTGMDFNLYHNEIFPSGTTVYIESAAAPLAYTSYLLPNVIRTRDAIVCADTKTWIDNILSKSNPLSTVNEKSRRYYFDRVKRRIEMTRNRLEMALNDY